MFLWRRQFSLSLIRMDWLLFLYCAKVKSILLEGSLQQVPGGCWSTDFVSGATSRAPSCLSQDVGYPVWKQQRGAPGFKGRGSGQGMERGRQDRGRRKTRPETEPCSNVWPLKLLIFNSVHFNMNHCKLWYKCLCDTTLKEKSKPHWHIL